MVAQTKKALSTDSTSEKTTEEKAVEAASTAKKPTGKKTTAKRATKRTSTARTSTDKTSTDKTAAKTATTRKKSVAKSDESVASQEVSAKRTTKAASVTAGESVTILTAEAADADGAVLGAQTQMPLDAIAVPERSERSEPSDKNSLMTKHFLAADCINDNIWSPSAAIPSLDEATYVAQKEQAEAQRRAIEVASLNLKNMNDLHRLEKQSIDVAISTKENETRSAQLANAEIDYQIQLETNGEKSQSLRQAVARKESATRESDYADQLIALKDQNFELDIQQAQNVFAEKAARYRAQLTGQG